MKKISINNASTRKLITLTIIAAVVLCAGAFLLFRSSPDSGYISGLFSSRSSAVREAMDSPGRDAEEDIQQQLPAGRSTARRLKTSLQQPPAEKKTNSVFFNNESPEENRKIKGARESVDAPQGKSEDARESEDTLPDIYEDEQEENDLQLLSISGYVLNQEGEPVHGIEVNSFAKRLFQSSEDTRFSGGRQSTISEADGFFSFRNLTEGEYEVSTKATEQYRSARASLRSGVNDAVLIVEENPDDQIYVFGYVTTTSGTPLAGVRVISVGQETQGIYTDDTGYYDVPISISILRKTYTFRFIRDGYREVRLTLRSTDVYGVDDIQLNAEMELINAMAPVTGTVTDRSNVPIEGAKIHLYSNSLRRGFQATTDHSGYFFIQDVEVAADYRLWVRQVDGYKDYIENAVEVPLNGVHLTVILDPLDFASLTGQMVDLSGNPVPWFSLWLRTSNMQKQILITGDQDGSFFVEALPAGRLQFMTLSFPYLNVSGIQISPGTNTNTLLVLDLGDYEIDGRVVDSTGSPVPGSEVLLTWSYREDGVTSWSKRRTYTDSEGYFLFSQLGSGQHVLIVTAPGYQNVQQKAEVNGGQVLIQLQEVLSNSDSLSIN